MAQNMQTQWQTVKALISLILSALFAGGLICVCTDTLAVCLPRPELLKVHSFRLLRFFEDGRMATSYLLICSEHVIL